MKELLEAGVHFGHQTKRWNPKMKKYIFGKRNGIYIIDLQKTLKCFREAAAFVTDVASQGKNILFVGTKRQAQDAIYEEANRCGMFYVNNRWLGGTLTNFVTIRKSISRLKEIEAMLADGIGRDPHEEGADPARPREGEAREEPHRDQGDGGASGRPLRDRPEEGGDRGPGGQEARHPGRRHRRHELRSRRASTTSSRATTTRSARSSSSRARSPTPSSRGCTPRRSASSGKVEHADDEPMPVNFQVADAPSPRPPRKRRRSRPDRSFPNRSRAARGHSSRRGPFHVRRNHMAISAVRSRKLRDKTGAGMLDCKNALKETNGNIDEAEKILRKKGLADAAKKAGRVGGRRPDRLQGRGGHRRPRRAELRDRLRREDGRLPEGAAGPRRRSSSATLRSATRPTATSRG